MPKELNLDQLGNVIWLYGLSGAGKTTISLLLKEKLHEAGYLSIILDGDDLRAGLNKDLSFTPEQRIENIRRVAEIAKLLSKNNIITICALITPLKVHRIMARNIIQNNLFEIFITCPLEQCEKRDVKGLYKLSREKKIKDFTGIDSAFEVSDQADLILSTADCSAIEATQILYNFVLSKL